MAVTHKAGFVNIIGNPNVGKSTLVNALMKEKLAITTPKAQTTRHRILGLLNGDDYQIVFSDTPGIIADPKYDLQESMMSFVDEAMDDADILLYVVEMGQTPDWELLEKIAKMGIPYFMLINKLDLGDQTKLEEAVTEFSTKIDAKKIIPVSALHQFNMDVLLDLILANLPESPAFFDKENISDRPARFFVSEMIREQILNLFNKEIPYSVEVVCDRFKETEKILKMHATVYTERESQRSILIGKQGRAIKQLGIEARKELEKFFDQQIFLELSIKVDKDWRKKENSLKKFGYKPR